MAGAPDAEGGEAGLEAGDQGFGLRSEAERGAHRPDVLPDAVQRCAAEPEHLGRTLESGRQAIGLAVGHRAHLAERLGDEEIGRQPTERIGVDPDDRPAACPQPAHLGIDAAPTAARDRSASR